MAIDPMNNDEDPLTPSALLDQVSDDAFFTTGDEAAAPGPSSGAGAAEQQQRAVWAAMDEPETPDGTEARNLDIVLDIPLEVSVELGRKRMSIREILDLGTGSIVELDKLAGEPVELLANGRLVARGEVVVIEDNFGVRITEIIGSAARASGGASGAAG